MIVYFFPLISALIGYFASYLTVFMLFKSYKSNDVADKLIEALILKLKGMDLEEDLDVLLEKHLIEFIGTLKQQIPMTGMFLTETLSLKLKNLAKKEFIKMLPELKENIWTKFSADLSFIETMIRLSVAKRMKFITLTCAGIGFIVGLIEMLIFII